MLNLTDEAQAHNESSFQIITHYLLRRIWPALFNSNIYIFIFCQCNGQASLHIIGC